MKLPPIFILSVTLSGCHGVSGFTSSSCPYPAGSPGGSTQQIVSPFQWDADTWDSVMGTFFDVMGDYIPGGGIAEKVWDVVSLLWGGLGKSQDDNVSSLISTITEQVESMIVSAIDQDVLNELDSMLRDIRDYVNEYETSGGCANLVEANNQATAAFNRMITYTVNEPYAVFLPHLLYVGTLHLSTRRTIYQEYDPSNPAWDACVSNIDAFLDYTKNTVYPQYYNTFLAWLPLWASWRLSNVVQQGGSCSGNNWKAYDSVTGMTCASRNVDSQCIPQSYGQGTVEVIKSENVANMLGTLQPFAGLHRLIPGWENNSTIYPSLDAKFPLNLYRRGIPMGPYTITPNAEFLCGKEAGWWAYSYSDWTGKIESITIKGYPQYDGWLTGIQAKYGHGSAARVGPGVSQSASRTLGSFSVSDYIQDGYISWVSAKSFTNPGNHQSYPVENLRFGFTNAQGQTNHTGFIGPNGNAAGRFMVNMTLGDKFALVGFSQGNEAWNGYGIDQLSTYWLPADLLPEFYYGDTCHWHTPKQYGSCNDRPPALLGGDDEEEVWVHPDDPEPFSFDDEPYLDSTSDSEDEADAKFSRRTLIIVLHVVAFVGFLLCVVARRWGASKKNPGNETESQDGTDEKKEVESSNSADGDASGKDEVSAMAGNSV